MRFKMAVILLLIIAVFPTLATGVAQEAVHAVLVALSGLVGGSHG